MSEEKKESCGCGSDCGCGGDCKCNPKSNRLLNNFFLLVIIVLLSGIFYTMQGMISMCPMMNKAHCGLKAKTAPCPMMNKGPVEAEK